MDILFKMSSIIFFPGKHNIDILGASRIIACNLFPIISEDTRGAIIGMGQLLDDNPELANLEQIDIRPEYLRKALPYRVIEKANSSIAKGSKFNNVVSSWVQSRFDILADRIAAEKLKILFQNDSSQKTTVGLSSMSFAFGKATKEAGMRFVLHSQWCHPITQNQLITDAYHKLKLPAPSFLKSKIYRQIKEYELADLIWCPSAFVQESLIENGVPKEKTFVSHVGVNINDFNVNKDARSPSQPFMILFVGSVCVQKGVHVLLEALLHSSISNTVMIFNGVADQPAKFLLREYEEKLANKNIFIKIDPGDPRRYHKKASIFVLPSVHDAFGIVVPEAMAAGLPVIVSTNVGAKECIKHGSSGFVFTSGDHKQLANYIDILFKSKKKRSEFGQVSHELAAYYDINLKNKKFLETIKS